MSERQNALRQYVSDMLALDRHILQAVERQVQDSTVMNMPETHQLIGRIETTMRMHVDHLEQYLETLGGDGASPVKNAVSSLLGVGAGLLDKVRTNTVSTMLRDDYTALSHAAIGYTMLHTTGLALRDQATADLALRHLKEVTPLITAISQFIPKPTIHDLLDEAEIVDVSVAERAARNVQEAWASEHIQQQAMNW